MYMECERHAQLRYTSGSMSGQNKYISEIKRSEHTVSAEFRLNWAKASGNTQTTSFPYW